MTRPVTHLACEHRLVIERVAFDVPEYASLVQTVKDAVERASGKIPDEPLDRVVMILEYGRTE